MTSKITELWLKHGSRISNEGWGRYRVSKLLGIGESAARALLDFIKVAGPPPEMKDQGIKKILVLSDIHFPFHNQELIDKVLKFIPELNPDHIVLNGDILDCYDLSDFHKDPSKLMSLQDEIDLCIDFLGDVRFFAGPECDIHLSAGNHEERLHRQLLKHPMFKSLDVLSWPVLLDLEGYNITHHEYTQLFKVGPVYFTHGHKVRKWSGTTARAHFEETHAPVIVGHSHRLAKVVFRDFRGTIVCAENGCLCDINQEYMGGKTPDWCNGFSVAHYWGDDNYDIQSIVFNKDNSFVYDGTIY